MRVIHFVAIYQRSAGTSLFASEVARELVENGVESVIACPDPSADGLFIPAPCVKVVSIDSILSGSPKNGDVFHIHGIWTPVLHRVSNWAHAHRVPLVWSPHGMLMPWALRSKFLKKLIGLALYQYRDLSRADLLHVTTDVEGAQVRRLHLINPMVIAPLGVNLDWSDEKLAQRRSELRGNVRTALFVSRINPGKGLVNLLMAWDKLRPEGWRLVIAGPDEENHLSELTALCETLSIPAVTFRGPVYGEEKDDLYASADLFVLPSFSENFSSVVVEALVAQVPVITTTGTPWGCLIDEGCGWCVEPNERALLVALQAAISLSDAERAQMGARGRDFACRMFNWKTIGETVCASYQNLIGVK